MNEADKNNMNNQNVIDENRMRFSEYVKKNDVAFTNLELSDAARDVLEINNKSFISEIVLISNEDICRFFAIDKVTAIEIIKCKNDYLRKHKEALIEYATRDIKNFEKNDSKEISTETGCLEESIVLPGSYEEYEKWIIENKKLSESYFKKVDIPLEELQITARSYNILRMNGFKSVCDVVFVFEKDIEDLNMMESTSFKEIVMFRRNYLRKQKRALAEFLSGKDSSNDAVEPDEKQLEERQSPETRSSEDIQFEVYKSEDLDTDNARNEIESGVVTESSLVEGKISAEKFFADEHIKAKFYEFCEIRRVDIETLNVSVRSYNCLRRVGVQYLHEILDFYPEKLFEIRNMGRKSVDECIDLVENYFVKNYDAFTNFLDGKILLPEENEEDVDIFTGIDLDSKDVDWNSEPFNLTITQMLLHPIFKNRAEEFLLAIETPIVELVLSVRAINALKRAQIDTTYDLIMKSFSGFENLRNVGAKTINEINLWVENYTSENQVKCAYFCAGIDMEHTIYPLEYIASNIIEQFKGIGFKGLSFGEIKNNLPNNISDERIKECIGSLIADKELEYVDFRLYKVYPSIYDFIEESGIDDDSKFIVYKRFNGETLEEIAREKGLTRERIRQKYEKTLRKIRGEFFAQCGYSAFDEDYYAYLYSNYEVIKEMWLDFLGVSQKTFLYLSNAYPRGKNSIKNALSDSNIDLALKLNIQDYLNRDKIMLDDVLVERVRSSIEDFVMGKICTDEITYSEFAEKYNEYLKDNGIDYDEKIYYTEDIKRTRANRLNESRYCLWKQGEKLRYYDIDNKDYTELLDVLNLKRFSNTEISTLKFLEDYPELMSKYDIRDQYELHNLLKKVVDTSEYEDMVFGRQPIIKFGEFDREKAICEILESVAPVTPEELAEYIYDIFGYDKNSIVWNHFKSLNQYYHNGIFSIDFKRIPEDRISKFKESLIEDFYYISDLKKLYMQMFNDADSEEVNHRSLKQIGFITFEKYAIQNFKTAEAYFTHVLTKDDVYDISSYNEKFISISMYRDVYYRLFSNREILLFEPNQVITNKRLDKLSVTTDDLSEFCDNVVNFVCEGEYFTIHSLKQDGFTSDLFDLGFDDYFYARLLSTDSRIEWQQIFGGIVLTLKTNIKKEMFSKKKFLMYVLSKYESIDIEDFINDCFEMFGVKIPDKYEITRAVKDTSFYYDEIMNKVYRDKSIYYSEFDD